MLQGERQKMKKTVAFMVSLVWAIVSFASWNGSDYWAMIRDTPTGSETIDGVKWMYYLWVDLDYVTVWPEGVLPKAVVIPDKVGGYDVGEIYGINGSEGWSVSIPGSVRRIERASFNGGLDSLTNVIVRDNIIVRTVIDEGAFQECRGIKSVSLGEGVVEVRRWSFLYCSGIEKVTLPKTLTTIGYAAFADMMDYYDHPEEMPFLDTDEFGNSYIGDWLITGWSSDKIREGTRGIADCAMRGGGVAELPEGLEYIGEDAFVSSLPWMIPESVKYIGRMAFGEPFAWYNGWCEGPLPEQDENGICYYDGWCFGPVDKNGWCYDEMEQYRIEEEMYRDEEWYQEQIQQEWYQEQRRFTESMMDRKRNLVLQDGTKGVAGGAFNATGCGFNYTMTNIVFPASMKYICNSAFEGCRGLQSFNTISNLECVGKYAFSQCDSLYEARLGAKVETLDYASFYECHELTNVFCGAVNFETLCIYSLSDIKLVTLHLYRPIKFVGDSAFSAVRMVFEEGMTEIEKIIGGGSEISIPSTVTNIAENAFEACPGLAKVVINIVNSDDVKFTGKVFSKNYNLKVVALPYNAKGYEDLIAQLGEDKVKFTVGTEEGFGQWVLVNGLAGKGSAADFGGKSGGNKYENGFLYIFGNEIENESVQLIQLDKTNDGRIAFRIPETEHEDKVRVVGTSDLSDWSNAVELKKEGDVWVMPDGTKPPESFFCRVIISE